MKKYNSFDHKMFLLGIIIPILLFFISMNATFAYFTASSGEKETNAGTAVLKIQFTNDTSIFANSQTITSSTKLLPGDTLSVTGAVENIGDEQVYVMIGFKLFVTKNGETASETIKESYYTIVNSQTTEIIRNNETYSSNAFVLDVDDSNNFSLSYNFNVNEFDNSYKKAIVTYQLQAYALQTTTITDATTATEMLMDQFAISFADLYQQVEYIQSTGTQYLDTKYIPHQDTKLEATIELTAANATQAIFCAREEYAVNSFSLFSMSSQELRYDYGTSVNSISFGLGTTKHTIVANKNQLFVDSVLQSEATYSDFSSPSSLWIGSSYDSSNSLPSKNATMKLYSFKIYEGENLVHNYIPCYRKSDGEIGLYDQVSGKFLTNNGTGTFLKGSDI